MISEGRFKKHQVEASCLTRPVCEKHYLHGLRKTCATFWHEKNIPLRTIQYWLGRKSLATTQKYLGIKDSAELQSQINGRTL
jgi:integrase